MNKKILNEINQMKYLFGYQRGVVISEQKKILNEGKIEDIVKGLKDASDTWRGTYEQDFANSLRKISNYNEYLEVNKLLSQSGRGGLVDVIYGEFDIEDKDDQYWLGKFDEHFGSIGITTSFKSGDKNVYPANQEVATPQNSPENTPGPGEPSGSAPAKPKETAPDKEDWNEIVKHYNATPESYESDEDDKIVIKKKIKITDNGKEYILNNIGDIRSTKTDRYVGEWSWENDNPMLNFIYKVTNPATGFVSGDSDDCGGEFCTNKKVAGRGATGKCVKYIQHYLLTSGLVDGIQLTKDLEACKSASNGCDGIYGRETEKAVRKFQEESKISVDGIVGCETWGYL